MSKISRNRHFSGIKAPQGATRHKGAFQKLTSIELIHFPYNIKNRLFPKKWKLDGNLPIKLTFLPKTKMVRMVHRNLFYNTELKNCDSKIELWRNTEHIRRPKNQNSVPSCSILLLRDFPKTTCNLKRL